MLTQQAISDRLELQQLLTDYATAIDERDFDALDQVFTPDAYIDYQPLGGIAGTVPEIKEWLRANLAPFPAYYHLVSNISLAVRDDDATGRAVCLNPVVVDLADGSRQTMFFGLWYHDRYLRTPAGWRISQRVESFCFDHNLPAGFGQPPSDPPS